MADAIFCILVTPYVIPRQQAATRQDAALPVTARSNMKTSFLRHRAGQKRRHIQLQPPSYEVFAGQCYFVNAHGASHDPRSKPERFRAPCPKNDKKQPCRKLPRLLS